MRKMRDRTEERFGIKPDWIAADTAYGAADDLVWLTRKRKILPFIPVFDKGERKDGTFSRSDFTWDDENDRYICPRWQRDVAHAAKLCGSGPKCTRLESQELASADVRLRRV